MESVQQHLFNVITCPWFVSWVGAICGYMLSLCPDEIKGCQPFLQKMYPEKSEVFYTRMEFLIFPVIMMLITMVSVRPPTVRSALFSGLFCDVIIKYSLIFRTNFFRTIRALGMLDDEGVKFLLGLKK